MFLLLYETLRESKSNPRHVFEVPVHVCLYSPEIVPKAGSSILSESVRDFVSEFVFDIQATYPCQGFPCFINLKERDSEVKARE